MSMKSFNICKEQIIKKKENGESISYDDVFDYLDKYSLSCEEIDSLIEMISGKEELSREKTGTRLDELFEKYNVVLFRKKRLYKENLLERDFKLEGVVPYSLHFDELQIKESSWGETIKRLSEYLIYTYPIVNEELYNFRTAWTNQPVFCPEQITNSKYIRNNLYINVNHTAVHSCWLIQDLLDFFGVDKNKIDFIVHRPPLAEPEELKEEIEKQFKIDFAKFLKKRFGKSEESAMKIISNIEKAMNPKLKEFSSSYFNFFLFDSYINVYNYCKEFEKHLERSSSSENNKEIMKRYLDYIRLFYKKNNY